MNEYHLSIARAVGGMFTRPEALRWGLTDNDLVGGIRSGQVERLTRGVYGLPQTGQTPEQRHAWRARAILRSRPDAWAGARSALALAGLPLVDADLDHVVLHTVSKEQYSGPDTVTYPLPPDEPEIIVDGARSVSLETAIFQTIARDSPQTAIAAADAALHRGLVNMASLEATHARLGRLATRGRHLLTSVDPRSESPGESIARLVITDLGHHVASQVEIRTPTGELIGRVDLLIDGIVIAEFDGAVKYERAEGRDALIREKRREDALRALGYVVIRITWSDLFLPGRIRLLIENALAQAAGHRPGPLGPPRRCTEPGPVHQPGIITRAR